MTVLLPVRDGASTITAALDSLTAQTLGDFKVWVLDDGSRDETPDLVADYQDPRVELLRDPRPRGRAERLNGALELVRSPYVARMDADDVCLPGRFAAQVGFLRSHPDIDICGTWIRVVGHGVGAVWRLPTDPDIVQAAMLFRSVLAHPTVLARTERLVGSGLRYRTDRRWAEDWDLWQRCANVLRLANVPDVHLVYTGSPPVDLESSEGDAPDRRAEVESIIAESLERFGLSPSADEVRLHRRIGGHDTRGELDFLDEADAWLGRLVERNAASHRYDPRAFRVVVAEQWFFLCYSLSQHRLQAVRRFLRSPLARDVRVPASRWGKWGVRLAQGRGG